MHSKLHLHKINKLNVLQILCPITRKKDKAGMA